MTIFLPIHTFSQKSSLCNGVKNIGWPR